MHKAYHACLCQHSERINPRVSSERTDLILAAIPRLSSRPENTLSRNYNGFAPAEPLPCYIPMAGGLALFCGDTVGVLYPMSSYPCSVSAWWSPLDQIILLSLQRHQGGVFSRFNYLTLSCTTVGTMAPPDALTAHMLRQRQRSVTTHNSSHIYREGEVDMLSSNSA